MQCLVPLSPLDTFSYRAGARAIASSLACCGNCLIWVWLCLWIPRPISGSAHQSRVEMVASFPLMVHSIMLVLPPLHWLPVSFSDMTLLGSYQMPFPETRFRVAYNLKTKQLKPYIVTSVMAKTLQAASSFNKKRGEGRGEAEENGSVRPNNCCCPQLYVWWNKLT